MKYKLVIEVKNLISDVVLSDRSGQRLDTHVEVGTTTKISTEILLPNKIFLIISDSQLPIELIGVWLGEIKFKKNALEKLFVYNHKYGQSRNLTWDMEGTVEFKFFEHSPIKYHLLMGSAI
jgi:hypothetical protein